MSARADELTQLLGLTPHIEGGAYRELFRSRRMVRTDDGRSERWASSAIHYLLRAGQVSRWHRVASDEAWHWYEGAAVTLHVVDPQMARHRVETLGPVGDGSRPLRIVPAGCWQAAVCTGEYALMGCTVSPAFEYGDFRLLADLDAERARFAAAFPALVQYL